MITHEEAQVLWKHQPNYAKVTGKREKEIQDRLVNLGLLFRTGPDYCGITDEGIMVLTDLGLI